MNNNVVILGAGGKMGCRITANIKDNSDYAVTYIEKSDDGLERLKNLGVVGTKSYDPINDADMLILAVPDKLIAGIAKEVVPLLKSGALLICLDPAAAYADLFPKRDDISLFVVHPCHPPLLKFQDNLSEAEQRDWFGGVGLAKMTMVCSLYQGKEEDYKIGEDFARLMFHPISESYRVTVEQMILLEPALVESISAPLIQGIKMALDACIAKGVPAEAATAFLMGHMNVQFGVIFGFAGFPFSDGAILALEQAMDVIFKPNWIENIMNIKAVDESVAAITDTLNKENK